MLYFFILYTNVNTSWMDEFLEKNSQITKNNIAYNCISSFLLYYVLFLTVVQFHLNYI